MYLALCDTNDQGCGKTYPGDLRDCPHCGAARDLIAVPAPLPINHYIYDIETYPNIFTFACLHPFTDSKWLFEISDRKNESLELMQFLHQLQNCSARTTGFNNIHFDWRVIDYIISQPNINVDMIYNFSQAIFKNNVPMNWDAPVIKQIDLFKINHFDNKSKSTSLKALEIAMRIESVQDLPYPPGTILNDIQKDELIVYNWHDVLATTLFWVRTLPMIEFRDTLTEKYNKDFTNHNDTKIGKDYFIMQLQEKGIACYNNGRPIQTYRPSINLGEVIFHYISFTQHQFNHILNYFKSTTITETKGVFTDLTATINGFDYVFGLGGLHASVEKQLLISDEYQIVDVDVKSFYPNIAIKNKCYPEHFSDYFCKIYEDVYNLRATFPKGSPENAMLKLALNGVYGDSNNQYSPFYDPKYTMTITINGQLLLCMLAEQLLTVPGLTMVQCNTDGVTYRCPVIHLERSREICKQWQDFTKLELEEALYSRFWIRDVNNYIAEYNNGKLKHKGAYVYEPEYHKDPSALIVPKAIEAHLVRGENIRHFITNHKDPYDFMLRAKIPKSSNLILRWAGGMFDQPTQHTSRYFVAKNGGKLIKVSPPKGKLGEYKRANGVTEDIYNSIMNEIGFGVWDARIHTKNKSKYEIRETDFEAKWPVMLCNHVNLFDWNNLDYEYYINEAEKLKVG